MIAEKTNSADSTPPQSPGGQPGGARNRDRLRPGQVKDRRHMPSGLHEQGTEVGQAVVVRRTVAQHDLIVGPHNGTDQRSALAMFTADETACLHPAILHVLPHKNMSTVATSMVGPPVETGVSCACLTHIPPLHSRSLATPSIASSAAPLSPVTTPPTTGSAILPSPFIRPFRCVQIVRRMTVFLKPLARMNSKPACSYIARVPL